MREIDLDRLFGGPKNLEQIRNKNNHSVIRRINISFTKYDKFICEIDGGEHCIDKECITLDCSHKFCKDCIKGNIEFELNRGNFKILCPGDECDCEINNYVMEYVLGREKEGRDLFQKYSMFKIQDKTLAPGDKLGRCPNSNCNYMVIYEPNLQNIFHVCPNCEQKFCLNGCHRVHEGKTCKEFELDTNQKEADLLFSKFKKENKMMDCIKCKRTVVKREGCNHIKCPCGELEFCYICGKKWKVCPCPHFDEMPECYFCSTPWKNCNCVPKE